MLLPDTKTPQSLEPQWIDPVSAWYQRPNLLIPPDTEPRQCGLPQPALEVSGGITEVTAKYQQSISKVTGGDTDDIDRIDTDAAERIQSVTDGVRKAARV